MQSKLSLYFAQITLLVIFLSLGIIFTTQVPLLSGRDELAHFRFTRFIVAYNRLPLTWDERKEAGYKAEWPPLLHLIIGLLGQGLDIDAPPFVNTRLTENNPRVQLVFGVDNVHFARALATEDPYQGELLLWYIGRWITLLTGVGGLGLTYWLIHSEQPGQDWLALAAVGALAFSLSYVRDSSVISYDPLLAIPLALYLLLLRTVQQRGQTWPYFGLGFLLGLAGLTKYTPLSVVPVVPLLILWLAYQQQWQPQITLLRLVVFGGGLLLTFGSWLLYMWLSFSQVAELGWASGSLSPFLSDNLGVGDQTSQWFAGLVTNSDLPTAVASTESIFLPTWLVALLGNIFGAPWLAWGVLILLAVALAGLIRQWRSIDQSNRHWLVLLITHLGLLMVFPILRLVIVGKIDSNTVAGQHVIFPVAAIVLLLLINGLKNWLTIFRLTLLFSLVAILALWQTVLVTTHLFAYHLPVQAVPLSDPEHTLATFDNIALLDYAYQVDEDTLTATLFWRANNILAEDYRIELTLLDPHGQAHTRWLGHPLNGRYPTRAWIIGDRIRDTIVLPLSGMQPGGYQLQLQLLNGANQPVEESPFNLGLVTLTAPISMPVSDSVAFKGVNIAYKLWPQRDPIYHERSTITLLTSAPLPDDFHLNLISPEGQAFSPVDQTQQAHHFIVEPHFPSGLYHFRFERWLNEELVEQASTGPLLELKTATRQFEIGPLAHPVQANFANQVALLGYDLPQRKVNAGESLPITLHWQALQTIGADLVTFNRIVDDDQRVFGSKDRQVRDVYSTLLWAPNEIVSDSFNLKIKADAPAGIYYLRVGLYLPVTQPGVPLPLVENGEFTEVTSVRLGPFKIGQTPAHFLADNPNPQHKRSDTLGLDPNLRLLGYDLEPSALTLYWQLLSPVELDYSTFVHIRNEAGEVVAQKDQPPLNGTYPTSLWDIGETIADEIPIALPSDLSAGRSYQIIIGLYDLGTGQRLSIPANSANEIVLTTLQIP